jgi:hypothetical protein
MAEQGDGIRLRAHHLLCMQGFQGYGYSDGFVQNMTVIVKRVETNPDVRVELVEGCDDICMCCPHAGGTDCVKDDESDERVRERDCRVLEKLGLVPGHTGRGGKLLSLVNAVIGTRAEADGICGACSWMDKCMWYGSRDG